MPDSLDVNKTKPTLEAPKPAAEREPILSPAEIEELLRAIAQQEEKEPVEGLPARPAETKEVPKAAPPVPVSHVIPLEERVAAPPTKPERRHAIEQIMASGLEEVYLGLDRASQQLVKTEGEKTAGLIEQLIEQGKDAAKKILQLIRLWLHKIPGVNRFFLEQESKIKTDKIMAMTRNDTET